MCGVRGEEVTSAANSNGSQQQQDKQQLHWMQKVNIRVKIIPRKDRGSRATRTTTKLLDPASGAI